MPNIYLDEETIRIIEACRRTSGLPSDSATVRQLIKEGWQARQAGAHGGTLILVPLRWKLANGSTRAVDCVDLMPSDVITLEGSHDWFQVYDLVGICHEKSGRGPTPDFSLRMGTDQLIPKQSIDVWPQLKDTQSLATAPVLGTVKGASSPVRVRLIHSDSKKTSVQVKLWIVGRLPGSTS